MLSNHLSRGETIALGLTAAAAVAVGIEFAPRLLSSAVVEETEALNLARGSGVSSLSEFRAAMAAKGLNTAEFAGDAGGAAHVPSFAGLQAAMRHQGLTARDIAEAESGANYINHGFYHDVYEIPKLSRFVLRVPKESIGHIDERFALQEVFDPAPEHNFGQAVGRIGEAQILKRVPGRPYGMFRDVVSKQALSDMHAAEVRMAAEWPQSKFDDLAGKLKIAEQRGLSFDRNNSHNLLVEDDKRLFHPIDFKYVSRGEHAHASINDMLEPLTRPPAQGLPPPTGWAPAEGHHAIVGPDYLGIWGEPDPLQTEYRAIVDKSFIAAKRAGLNIFQDEHLDDLMRSAGVEDRDYERMFRALYRG